MAYKAGDIMLDASLGFYLILECNASHQNEVYDYRILFQRGGWEAYVGGWTIEDDVFVGNSELERMLYGF